MSFLWLLTVAVASKLALTAAYSNSSFVCTEYSADNTASTTAAYCTCDIYLCPGDSVTISGCASCNFDYQYIRLYNANNIQVAYNDGTGSSCAPCAEIVNYVPAITYCQYYTLREGCLNNNQCNGEMEVTVTSLYGATNKALRPRKPTKLGTSDPHLMLKSFGKMSLDSFNELAGYSAANDSEALTTSSSSSSSSLPTCTYVIDLGALGLVIGIIVAIIVSSVCGFCCLAAICFFVCLPCIAPCWYANQQQQKAQQQQMQQQQMQQQVQMHNVLHQQQQAGQPVYYANGVAAVPGAVPGAIHAAVPAAVVGPAVNVLPPAGAQPAVSDPSDIQKY